MKSVGHKIVNFYDNDAIRIYFAADGTAFCPVCGFPGFKEAPWSNDDEDDVWPGPSFDLCPDCKTEFGLEDSAPRDARRGSRDGLYKQLRLKWLQGVSSERYISPLENIGILIDEARALKKESEALNRSKR